MTTVIKIKRSEVAGNPATLGAGELAYSALADNGSNGGDRLYIGMGTETSGNAVNHVVIGGKYFTDMINAATASNTVSTIVKRDSSGNFTAGTITAALTGNASTASTWQTARNLVLSGDGSATLSSVNGSANVTATLTLATVNTAVGTYGSGSIVPVITVNAKGLITNVTTATISASGALTISDGTTSDVVTLGTDTLTFAAGTGVTTTVTNNQVSFAIGQAVSTTSNVTFNNMTVNGTLTVNGTTTTINATTLDVADLNITVAKGAATAAAANGAGLTVDGATATLTYTNADDRWNFNKALNVSTVYGALSGNATTATTWQTARNLVLSGDGAATLSSVNGSANVTATLTLATVNSNVGAFGDSVTIPTITVNAKGLVTAVTTTGIPTATVSVLGLSKFDSNNFTVTAGSVSITTLDGGTY